MAELNVIPADLVQAADSYRELAARAARISPEAVAQVQMISQTHGLIGYSSAVGVAAGLAAREGPLLAKVSDFTRSAERFTEHAAAYLREDAHGEQRMRATNFGVDSPRPGDRRPPSYGIELVHNRPLDIPPAQPVPVPTGPHLIYCYPSARPDFWWCEGYQVGQGPYAFDSPMDLSGVG
jgi:hypothetical protein